MQRVNILQFGQLGIVIPDSGVHSTPTQIEINNGNVNSVFVDIVTGFSQTMVRTSMSRPLFFSF
jgi:hypothetical protein